MAGRLLVFPMEKELRLFLDYFRGRGIVAPERSVKGHAVAELECLDAICSVGGHGKVQCGVQTQFLLTHVVGVKAAFCVGCCGGLSESVSVLDIVAGSKTIEHDYKVRFIAGFAPPVFECDPDLLARFAGTRVDAFRIHAGTIASGDEDIVDSARARQLHEETGAIAVAWEGAGCARACLFNKMPFLEVRAVTDNARRDAPSEFAKNLPRAMANAARAFESVFYR